MKLLALPILLMLGACTAAGQGAVSGAIEEVKSFNDAAATVTIEATCATPYGAVLRRPANERLGLKLICDPAALDSLVDDAIR